jgi:subtilase family serine protease
MNFRRLLLITLVVLVVCQLGWAQATGDYVRNLALKAQQLGHGLPVVPASAIGRGQARPFIWVGGLVTEGLTPKFGTNIPSICNTLRSYGTLMCPNGLETAYGVPFKNTPAGKTFDGTGTTIAIVDAFHYASAEADLLANTMNLGLSSCTKLNGCFKDLDQYGNDATNTTCGDAVANGWAVEIMLDLVYAHAMAPGAKLVLVEGCTNNDSDLYQAVTTATGLADIVSDSWGEGEYSGETGSDYVFNVNKPILFASGDSGSPGIYPCASPYVTCVGGTSLQINFTTLQRVNETGWSGSGGGCSPYESLPGYQASNGVNLCYPYRALPDVAADGADTSPVLLYYSAGGGTLGGYRVWGTSLATPLTAGILAVDMQARGGKFLHQVNGDLYTRGCHGTANCVGAGQINSYFFYDVTTGNNGLPAGPGYDLVTGMGVTVGKGMGGLYGIPTP